MQSQYKELYNAARLGTSQDQLNLLAHVSFDTVADSKKYESSLLVWRRNAERHGHPRLSFMAARNFGTVGRYDLEKACLEALSSHDIAPAIHVLAQYKYQDGNLDDVIELSKRSAELNYDPGKSLYYLARSKKANLLKRSYFWLKSRFYYKRAVFWRLRNKSPYFFQVWFDNEFNVSEWQAVEHSKLLLAAVERESANLWKS